MRDKTNAVPAFPVTKHVTPLPAEVLANWMGPLLRAVPPYRPSKAVVRLRIFLKEAVAPSGYLAKHKVELSVRIKARPQR